MGSSAYGVSPRGGSFKTKGATATAGTAYTIGVPPYPGPHGSPPGVYAIDSQGYPTWYGSRAAGGGYFTKVNNFFHNSGSTQHTLFYLRPLNWSVVAVAGAKNTTAFTLADNPGAYSTNFHYPTSKGVIANTISTAQLAGVVYGPPSNVADLTPGSTHYFAVQLSDGTWFFDLLSAFSTSTFVVTTTTTIPNITGGGVPAGAIFFLLGTTTTVDPNTGYVPPAEYPLVSVMNNFTGGEDGVCTAVHPGDPMMLYNLNATGAGFTGGLSGSYCQL